MNTFKDITKTQYNDDKENRLTINQIVNAIFANDVVLLVSKNNYSGTESFTTRQVKLLSHFNKDNGNIEVTMSYDVTPKFTEYLTYTFTQKALSVKRCNGVNFNVYLQNI